MSDAPRDGVSAGSEETTGRSSSAAEALRPLLERLFGGDPPVRFEFWDGSALGPGAASPRVRVRSKDALRRLLWAPDQLGLGRAYVAGELELEPGPGATFAAGLRLLHDALSRRTPGASELALPLVHVARELDLIGPPPPPPAGEVRLTGRLRPSSAHSKERDAAAIRHHYDIGNDFYALVLGPSMTYSCARFESPSCSLEEAQASKHDLICRKLGLHEPGGEGRLLLDIGSGWGSMVLHAASRYGVQAVGVTLSRAQADLARKRIAEAGLTEKVDVRIQDYRDLGGQRFDAISSIGMFEHVGKSRMDQYFTTVSGLLTPRGRFLNHAISRPGGSKMRGRSFMNRYVFPDGELIDVGDVIGGMERAGLEVRDVESLREHYARTLRCWVANLERHWDEAVALVGEERARVWRLYMSASVNAFEDGGIAIHQVLGVKPDSTGSSGVPPTRAGWV